MDEEELQAQLAAAQNEIAETRKHISLVMHREAAAKLELVEAKQAIARLRENLKSRAMEEEK